MLYELKNIRKASGKTQKETAALLGVAPGTYRNWEQCIYAPQDNRTLKRIADLFHVSIEALFGYDVVAPGTLSDLEADENNIAFRYVPIYGRIAAGHPLDWEDIDGHMPVPIEVMKRHPHSFLLLVEGQSMNRVLPDGCYALVDPDEAEPIIEYKVYAVCVNGYSATIKRIRLLANGIELIPDSLDHTYRPTVYDYNDPDTVTITIIGRVVWYCIPFDYDI